MGLLLAGAKPDLCLLLSLDSSNRLISIVQTYLKNSDYPPSGSLESLPRTLPSTLILASPLPRHFSVSTLSPTIPI